MDQLEDKLRKREENRQRILERKIAKAQKASLKIQKIKERKQRKQDLQALEVEICPQEEIMEFIGDDDRVQEILKEFLQLQQEENATNKGNGMYILNEMNLKEALLNQPQEGAFENDKELQFEESKGFDLNNDPFANSFPSARESIASRISDYSQFTIKSQPGNLHWKIRYNERGNFDINDPEVK